MEGNLCQSKSLTIGMLVFPRMTQLDLTGPFEVFARIPDAKVHLLWKRKEPMTSDAGLSLLPTLTLAECPPLDVVCIPGGPGQIDLMDDEEVIAFVRKQGQQAQYVTGLYGIAGAWCSRIAERVRSNHALDVDGSA